MSASHQRCTFVLSPSVVFLQFLEVFIHILLQVRLAANSCVTKNINKSGDYGGFPAVSIFSNLVFICQAVKWLASPIHYIFPRLYYIFKFVLMFVSFSSDSNSRMAKTSCCHPPNFKVEESWRCKFKFSFWLRMTKGLLKCASYSILSSFVFHSIIRNQTAVVFVRADFTYKHAKVFNLNK